jgi:hypothetical protein
MDASIKELLPGARGASKLESQGYGQLERSAHRALNCDRTVPRDGLP